MDLKIILIFIFILIFVSIQYTLNKILFELRNIKKIISNVKSNNKSIFFKIDFAIN